MVGVSGPFLEREGEKRGRKREFKEKKMQGGREGDNAT